MCFFQNFCPKIRILVPLGPSPTLHYMKMQLLLMSLISYFLKDRSRRIDKSSCRIAGYLSLTTQFRLNWAKRKAYTFIAISLNFC